MSLTKATLSAVLGLSAVFPTLAQLGWAGQTFDAKESERRNRLGFNERVMQLVKTLWPECENQNVHWCKDLIDSQLAEMTFPGAETITSIIIYNRTPESATSNAVVILMDDNDLCVGRKDDGLLYYDFDWCGIGEELTDPAEIAASKVLIQPTAFTKDITIDPNVQCPAGVEKNTSPIFSYGGNFDPNSCSTLEGYTYYDEIMNQAVDMPPAGCRKIGPFNCAGMTCMDACETVKHLVPDANTDRKQIECWCSYKAGSAKLQEAQTETKVRIYANKATDLVVGVPNMQEGSAGPALPA